jgi:hypothetical protein
VAEAAAAAAAAEAAGAAGAFVQLTVCAVGWLGGGDEPMAHTLLTSLLLTPRWLRRLRHADGSSPLSEAEVGSLRPALLEPYVQLLKGNGAAPEPAPAPRQLHTLRRHASQCALPLPADWLMRPLHIFGVGRDGELDELTLRAQVLACLRALLLWLPLAPARWLPRPRLLCRVLQVFVQPAAPWADAAVSGCLARLLPRCTAPPSQGMVPALLGLEGGLDAMSLVEQARCMGTAWTHCMCTAWALYGCMPTDAHARLHVGGPY